MERKDIYNFYIYNRYQDLLKAKHYDFNNNDLCKIFEYYSCIKLTEEYKTEFLEYSDIHPEFKEQNQMTKNDTGIDCCNLIDTIVQCKLRKNTLTWKECSTFFGSQNVYDETLNKPIVKWEKLIITRNNECKLAPNLQEKHRLFIDKPYSRTDIINYCEELFKTPPVLPIINQIKKIRDYQQECVNLIQSSKNIIISLPTGTGKNFIIINSLQLNKKYLILVPRIILMDQIKDEIIEFNSKFKNNIQLIGDTHFSFGKKNITICVYNSVKIVEEYASIFHKIFIDEAHHIHKPNIYKIKYLDTYSDTPDSDSDDSDSDDSDDSDNDDSDIKDSDSDDSDSYDSDSDDSDSDDSDSDDSDIKDSDSKYSKYSDINKDLDTSDSDIKDTYIKVIDNLKKWNNNVYLSATIDKKKDFVYYEKNIRDMINKKYLSDYTINIPVFSDDPTNQNICQYLLKNYRNIIIYCNTKKEGKQINKLLNNLQNNSSDYIDCDTSKVGRDKIINKYKTGILPFLVNVRILIEGFDAPITKGVCFMHLPFSKTTIIQIIGRALRLHPLKSFATIILPFSSKEDESSIFNFMKVISKNDYRLKETFNNRKLGGYVSIQKVYNEENEENEDNEDIIQFKYDLIFDSMGNLKNGSDIWNNKLKELKLYLNENKKRPSDKDINTKTLGIWLSNQLANYKTKKKIMLNNERYDNWTNFINDEKYIKYFVSNEDIWNNKLKELKLYVNENKKRPSIKDINTKTLGLWLSDQLTNYKTKKKIMAKNKIYDNWTNFINDEKYIKYFVSNEDIWNNKLKELKLYFNEKNSKPSIKDKDAKTLRLWLSTQLTNYKTKKNIMLNNEIYDNWTIFINDEKYIKYFVSNEDIWNNKLKELKLYLNDNNSKPPIKDINTKTLGLWLSTQTTQYKTKKKIMSKNEIYDNWTNFINDEKYIKYFK